MEINDKMVFIQIGRLGTIGEHTGHKFDVTNEGEKYKYCVWIDGNKVTPLASCLTSDELRRYVDGLRDMFLIFEARK